MIATKKKPAPPAALPGSAAAARTAAAGVEDAGLRTALESLGTGVLGRKTRNSVTKA
jgi:hypothetical protein